MRNLGMLATLIASIAFGALAIAPAQAPATRTWVSGVGDDANPCSRTAPCKTFAGAISKTAPAGEINCFDLGGYGAVTITKALSILCDAGEAGVLVPGTNGISIAAGASDVVNLKGLDIDGIGTGLNGVQFNSGAALRITDCIIHQFSSGVSAGVAFAPSGAVTSKLVIESTVISENGGVTSGFGIIVAPTNGAVADVTLKNVQVTNSTGAGVRFDVTGTGGGRVNAVMRDSTVAQNSLSGVIAVGPQPVQVLLDGVSIMHNGGFGINASGVGALVTMTRSSVTENVTGLAITNGVIASYGDNEIDHNNNIGATPSTIAHQ